MNIIAKESILYYIEKYPNAKTSLLTWYYEFSRHSFENFNALKAVYGNASIVGGNRIIFNIKGNDYRLVVTINFKQGAAYVIWFGTHNEYDKINVVTVTFDTAILNYKTK